MSDTAFDLPELPDLEAEITKQSLEPDYAAKAIRQWRDEARPLVVGAAETQEEKWALADELSARADAAIAKQRQRASTIWAASSFETADDLQGFWSAYDQAGGDPKRMKSREIGGLKVDLDTATAERYSRLGEELNNLITHPAFKSTREERDMTGKVMAGETTLARYTMRVAGNEAEVVMTPDNAELKPLAFKVPVPTDDEVKAAAQERSKRAAVVDSAISEIAMNQENFTPTDALDSELKKLRDEEKALMSARGKSFLINERIQQKVKDPEFAQVGDSTWGAAGEDILKGLAGASFNAAGLVSRVLPRTMEHALEAAGGLPETGSVDTPEDRSMKFFAEARNQLDGALPGSTRNQLIGGFWNELSTGSRVMAGDMLPYLGAGLASKVIAGAEGRAAMEAMKAAGVVPMGATGASMGAGMTGGSYLESTRRIVDAEAAGDKETADRIRRGMDAHAILTGAMGAGFSKMSPLHNLEFSSGGSVLADVVKQAAEMPLMGITQRMIIDPATLGDHPDIFGPVLHEVGLGAAMAFPMAAGSKIIEGWQRRKVQIEAETTRAKDLARETGADDTATLEAIDQAHQVKIAGAAEEAAAAAVEVASKLDEIDQKLIEVERDPGLDEMGKRDAREPLIKAKLEIYTGKAEEAKAIETVPAPVEVKPTEVAPPPAVSEVPPVNEAPPTNEAPPAEPTTKIFVRSENSGPTRIMPNSPLGGKDILDFVSGMQIGPPRAQTGPEGDYDWKEQRSVPPFYQQRLFNKGSENGIDTVAQAAYRRGMISAATPDALMSKIFEAIDARKQARMNQKIEGRMMREGEAKMIDFDQEQAKLEAKPSATEVHISELNKGDVVTVGGDPMEVVSVKFDEDGAAQETTVRSERFGDITLDQNNRPTMMADAPAEKANISTDFLGEEDFTSDQPPASLAAIDQPSQEPRPQSESASAAPGQASGEASSGQNRGNVKPVASSDSPDARSIKNAQIDQWRADRGLEPMAQAGRKSWGSLWDSAEDKLAADPRAGANLVQRLVDEARPHTDEEVPLMLQHFMRQENAATEASEAINRLDPSSPEYAEAVNRKRDADAQIEMTHLAARLSGTATGRSLAARKMMVDRSDVPQLGAMMADRKIDLGRNLSPEERSQVETIHKELTDGKAEHDKAMQQIESEQLTADNSAAVDAIANEILQLSADPAKRQKIGKQAREKLRERHDAAMKILREKGIIGGKTTNAMGLGGDLDGEAIKAMVDVATYYIVEAGGVVADAVTRFSKDFAHVAKEQVEKIFDNAQKANARLEAKLSEIAKSNDAKTKQKTPAQIIDKAKSLLSPEEDVDPAVVRALHRAHIAEGAKSEGDVTSKVADSLGKIYGRKFTPDEVRRIHSQYGRVAKLPSDEVSLIQRDIKRQQLLLVKIEALKKKEPLLATGTAREQNSHEVHKLQQELEAMKRATNYRKTGPDQLSGLQDRIAARLDTLIADTKDQILGNKPIKAGKEPTEYDADNMARLEELKALRRELRARRPGESSEAADKAAIKAALASKKLYEDKLRIREWEEGPAPKAKPSAALSAARAERDQAIKDYHEAERSSAEWKARELARKTAAASEELDMLERKLSDRDTSKRPKKEQLSNQELDLMRARKEEINKELADLRKRDPMTPDEERIYLEERLKAAQETEAKLTEELSAGVRKTPFRRERPTSPELEAARKRIADLRKQVAKARFGDGQEAFDEWARERIKTLNDQLKNGRKPGGKRIYPDTAENRAKLAEIKDLENELKSKEAPAKRLASLEKRIEAKKDEIAKLQRDGYTPKAEAPPATTTPEIDRAQAELEALMKIEDKWHEDDGARDNAAYRKRLDAAEKVLNDRMAKKDFAPKPKKQIKLTAETAARLEKFREAQKKYFEMKLADRLANMSTAGKILDAAGQSLAVVRTVRAGGEFSMAGRQGLLPATMALRKAPDALLKMFQSFASEKSVTEAELNLKARQNYDRYQRDKLFLSDVKDWTERKVEEANSGRWARRIPFFKNFERANSTVLNILRANAYDAMHNLHRSLFGVEPTPEQGRAIAMQVNIMSGRGEFGKFENARAVGSKILFSPGHTLSRFQYIGGGALWAGDAKSKAVITLAYGKTIASLAALIGLTWFASGSDQPIETDPRSSDFLKIKVGPTRIDVMAGLSQAIVFASRMLSREAKRGGKVVPLTGPDVKYGAPDLGSTIGAFGRSKLNPFLGSAFNAWSEKDFSGNPTDWEAELNELWKPMTWVDITDTAQAQGAPKTILMMIGAMLGAGVSTYEPRKPKASKSRRQIDIR